MRVGPYNPSLYANIRMQLADGYQEMKRKADAVSPPSKVPPKFMDGASAEEILAAIKAVEAAQSPRSHPQGSTPATPASRYIWQPHSKAELPPCPTNMYAEGSGASVSQGGYTKKGDGTGNCR